MSWSAALAQSHQHAWQEAHVRLDALQPCEIGHVAIHGWYGVDDSRQRRVQNMQWGGIRGIVLFGDYIARKVKKRYNKKQN